MSTEGTAKKDTSKPGAQKKNSIDAIRTLLEIQDSYTLQRPETKPFARNPYTVTYVMNVWECDFLDVQAYTKYNDNHRHILSVLDVFSKFLHKFPVKTRIGSSIDSAFRPYSMTWNIRKHDSVPFEYILIREGISKYTFAGHVTGRGGNSVTGVSKPRLEMCGRGT